MKVNKEDIKIFLVLQLMNILYSLNSVLIKVVSNRWESDGLFVYSTVSVLMAAIFIMAIYALLWQKILSNVDLVVAYMCKGLIVFWGMLWAFLLFNEHIGVLNLLGAALIFCGTYLVTVNG